MYCCVFILTSVLTGYKSVSCSEGKRGLIWYLGDALKDQIYLVLKLEMKRHGHFEAKCRIYMTKINVKNKCKSHCT